MAAVDPAALLSAQLEDIIGGGGAGGKIILPPPTTAAAMMQAGVNAAGVSGSLGGSTVFRAGGMPLPAAFGWAQEGMAPRVPLVPTVLQGQPAHTLPQDPMWWMETCPAKTGISFIVGGGLGLVTGIVLGGWQSYLYETGEMMGSKSVSWMKNFAKVGGIFSAVECVVEKSRGKHDIQNSVISGCIAGAALSYKNGAAAMAAGCGGFAAFSVVIDLVMAPH
ncbi:Timm22 [Symbiodinium sp. KB8]|nr:Timm22 [Symbiodinium sp. KB8]